MTKITDLPPEILSEVLGVDGILSRSDFANVSLTSKFFVKAAQFYHNRSALTISVVTKGFYLLFRKLLQDPNFRVALRDLTLDWDDYYYDNLEGVANEDTADRVTNRQEDSSGHDGAEDTETRNEELYRKGRTPIVKWDERDVEAIHTLAADYSFDRELTEALLTGRHVDALVLGIIYLSPSLESFDIGAPTLDDDHDIEFYEPHLSELIGVAQGDASKICWPPGLLNLKHFKRHHHDTEGGFSADVLVSMLFVPRIETITVHMATDDFHSLQAFSNSKSNVKELCFDYSQLGGEDLAQLIAACRCLESLSVEWDACAGYSYDPLAATTIKDALLAHQKGSLKRLRLDENAQEEEETTFGSLRDFEVLTHADIPGNILGVGDGPLPLQEYLPASIISVRLLGSHKFSEVTAFLENYASEFPHLKTILFGPLEEDESMDGVDVKADCLAECRKAGIELRPPYRYHTDFYY